MTAPADPQLLLDQAVSRLTGPGGPFEIVEEEVLGTVMPVMKNRGHAIGELISASRAWGDGDYLVTSDRRISFTEHADSVAALATALRDKYGVRKGDRVGILAANTPEWVMTFFATQALGAIAVGLNGWWVPREVTHGIELSRPKVLVVDAKRGAALPELPADITVLTMEEDLPALIAEYAGSDRAEHRHRRGRSCRHLVHQWYQRPPQGRTPFAPQRDGRRRLPQVQRRDRRCIQPAASTTLPSRAHCVIYSPPRSSTSPACTIWWSPRLATGSAVILTEGGFDVDKVLGLVERERVTNWGAVPTMASRLLEHGNIAKYDVSSLTAFSLASAPSSPAFKERLKEQVPFARNALVDSYGLTECSTAIAVAVGAELEEFPGTLGRPIITVSMEIRDPFGEWLPDGIEGEVCVRSPFVMLGYWENDEATESAIAPGRWLRTGDFGVIENGRLRLTGRRSDLILRGGENVYPTEIEQTLDEHPRRDRVRCHRHAAPRPRPGSVRRGCPASRSRHNGGGAA